MLGSPRKPKGADHFVDSPLSELMGREPLSAMLGLVDLTMVSPVSSGSDEWLNPLSSQNGSGRASGLVRWLRTTK